MSKKIKDKNPFTEAFKKLPPNATPHQLEQVIKEILRANGLDIKNVSIVAKNKRTHF